MSNIACNYTILQENCTLQTCCLNQGTVDYIPSLSANIVYLSIFALLLALQLGLALWYRTWTFMIGMTFGLLCEIIGYAGRIWMHYSIFDMNPFILYGHPMRIRGRFTDPLNPQIPHLRHPRPCLHVRFDLHMPVPHCQHL